MWRASRKDVCFGWGDYDCVWNMVEGTGIEIKIMIGRLFYFNCTMDLL